VRIRVAASGINPGDVKKRQNAFGVRIPYPRVIPHSDGAGIVDAIGEGVPHEWAGQRVWCYAAQTYRPFGTAAEYAVVPVEQAVPLPAGVSAEQGACLGIPGITAHRGCSRGGSSRGAHRVSARRRGCGRRLGRAARASRGGGVIATCREAGDQEIPARAGVDEVLLADETLAGRIKELADEGVDHIIEVAFGRTSRRTWKS
jgi:NADPH:quinone reductase